MVYNIGMTKVSTAVARKRFSDVVNRASYAKERVALTRYGHTLAAIVPAEDLALLEAMSCTVMWILVPTGRASGMTKSMPRAAGIDDARMRGWNLVGPNG
jgi:prevent-host-death family protein